MAVSRKVETPTPKETNVDVDALINKGGSVPQEEDPVEKTASVVLRIPGEMLTRVDMAVNKRPIKTPRHTWLLEAIIEKLVREDA